MQTLKNFPVPHKNAIIDNVYNDVETVAYQTGLPVEIVRTFPASPTENGWVLVPGCSAIILQKIQPRSWYIDDSDPEIIQYFANVGLAAFVADDRDAWEVTHGEGEVIIFFWHNSRPELSATVDALFEHHSDEVVLDANF